MDRRIHVDAEGRDAADRGHPAPRAPPRSTSPTWPRDASTAFWEFGLAPWDTAAGTLLLLEAGGRIGTLTGQPYTQGGHVVAATPKVFDELVACIGPYVPANLRDV